MNRNLILLIYAIVLLLPVQCLAQNNELLLKAPEEILELWRQWDGKYAIFVHKEASIKDFADLDGVMLMVAFIDSNEIMGDAQNFSTQSGVKLMLGLQNNPDMYDKQFLKQSSAIGIMIEAIA